MQRQIRRSDFLPSNLLIRGKEVKGSGVRARRGGKKSWVAVYRVGRKVCRVTIGDATIVGPDEARAKAREVLAKAKLGEDTQAKRKEEKTKAVIILGATIELYIQRCVEKRQRPKTQYETKRYLRSSWRQLHDVPLHQGARREITMQLSSIVGEKWSNFGKPGTHGAAWFLRMGDAAGHC